MLRYVLRDLVRNPRRTLASVAGIALAVGLLSGVSFFVDSSVSQMTARAVRPIAIDMQVGLVDPLAATVPGGPVAELSRLAPAVASVAGVGAVHPYASVDLPAGALRAAGASLGGQVTLIGVDPAYLASLPAIQVSGGPLRPGAAVISGPAAGALGAAPGAALQLAVPGRAAPIDLRLAGVVDFTPAAQLFASRNPDTQGELAAAPYVAAVDLATFRDLVLPALRSDAGSAAPVLRSPPVMELHAAVSRAALSTDPGTAAVTTTAIRRTLERIAPGRLTVIDNLSEALSAAQSDAVLAKVLFVVLGLPGIVLAAYLSHYAGGLLADGKRRERAILRARGASPRTLLLALAYESAAITVVAGVLGLAMGAAALALLFGRGLAGSAASYALSAGLSVVTAALTTVVALYLPARRALLRDVAEERRLLATGERPAWLRLPIDLGLLAAAAVVAGVTYLAGGYTPTANAESSSVSLSFYTLLAPLFGWLGATLLAARLAARALGALGARRRGREVSRLGVRAALAASVARRPEAIAGGIVALALAVSFGTSLLAFVNTHAAEKAADARFQVGADVRVTPSLLAASAGDLSRSLRVPGVLDVAAVYRTSSAKVGADTRALVAIDPAAFGATAPLADALFDGTTAQAALAALAADPSAVLVSRDLSRTFNIQPGDRVNIALPGAGGKPVPVALRAVGVFSSFPGFLGSADLVGSAAGYRAATGATAPDLYLLRTAGTAAANAAVASELRAGPGRSAALLIQTTATALGADQSTLAAVDLGGLGRLESLFTVLMSVLGVGIFVFGLMLRRRSEYVTVRALGMRLRQLQALVVGEVALVVLVGSAVGVLVGLAMALAFVQILRPLFTVPPAGVVVPTAALGALVGTAALVGLVSAILATMPLRRMPLVELLRQEA